MAMHYKNGRPAKVGDWVVGPTHNSSGLLRVGVVTELMPQQGPCNVRLHIWRDQHYTEEGTPVTVPAVHPHNHGEPDYADAKELFHVMDAFRMASAVHGSGLWNAPYFDVSMESASSGERR